MRSDLEKLKQIIGEMTVAQRAQLYEKNAQEFLQHTEAPYAEFLATGDVDRYAKVIEPVQQLNTDVCNLIRPELH